MMKLSVLVALAICVLSGSSSNALEILADDQSESVVLHDIRSVAQKIIVPYGEPIIDPISLYSYSYLIVADHGEPKDSMIFSNSSEQASLLCSEFMESAYSKGTWVIAEDTDQNMDTVLVATYALVLLVITVTLIRLISEANQSHMNHVGIVVKG